MSLSLSNKILACLMLVVLAAMCCSAAPQMYNENFPPPPERPEKFNTKEELKEYLVKLFTYYSIVERPRFGRRSLIEDLSETGGEEKGSSPIYESEINYRDGVPMRYISFLIDENHDGFASGNEIYKFVNMFKSE